jgi:predicted PurR-regulated permease PerM
MTPKIKQTIFYIAAFIIIITLSVGIFRPYLMALAVAGMLAVILEPLYAWLLAKVKSPSAAATLTIVLLMLVIIIPLILISNQIISEAQGLYTRVASGDTQEADYVSLDNIALRIEHAVKPHIPSFSFDLKQYLGAFSGWIAANFQGIFSGTVDLIIKFILGIVALFYFLRDGEEFKRNILAFSPLSLSKDKIIVDSLKDAIHSVLVGSVMVAIIHGIINGVGLAILGVPNFTLWATAAAIASFVPFIGPALVWVPATIYLYFYGWSGAWVIMLVWSVFFMIVMNNFLAPHLFNRGIRIHPIFVLFAILGGLQLFGPAGFLVGPLVISLLFVLIRVVELSEDPEPKKI